MSLSHSSGQAHGDLWEDLLHGDTGNPRLPPRFIFQWFGKVLSLRLCVDTTLHLVSCLWPVGPREDVVNTVATP